MACLSESPLHATTLDIDKLLRDVRPDLDTDHVTPETGQRNHDQAHVTAGLLTKTIIRSTLVKHIIQARIRSPYYNDVVFIGDHFIELHEILGPHGVLERVVRHDFAPRIRTANVLSKPHTLRAFADDFMKAEDLKDNEDDKANVMPQPQQMVLMTTDDHNLLYVTVRPDSGVMWVFEIDSVPLPAAGTALQDLGEYIAVDIHSRAFAIAPWQGTIMLCNAQLMLETPSRQNTITSSMIAPCDMIILNLIFLMGANVTDDAVYLLVVGSSGGRLRMNIFSWNSTQRLDRQQQPILTHSQTLGREHSIPTLLIPLKSPGSFLIVCENAVTVYSKAHLGHVEQTACMEHSKSTVEYDRPRVSGESRRYPTLVAWGRPRRNNSFLDDWLYLAREDGLILYLQLTYGSDTPRITSRGSIGRLECDLSRAFAVVDLGQSELVSRVHGPDVVIAVGNVGSGGCWEIGHIPDDPDDLNQDRETHMTPIKQQLFTNYAPFTDVALVAHPDFVQFSPSTLLPDERGAATTVASFGHVFATSGKGRSSSICELRHGYEASLETTLNIESLLPLAGNVFSLKSTSIEHDIVIVSSPLRSLMIAEVTGRNPSVTHLAMEPTLAVSLLRAPDNSAACNREILVHVVPCGLRLYYLNEDFTVDEANSCNTSGVSCAVIDAGLDIIVYTTHDESGTSLWLCKLILDQAQPIINTIGSPFVLETEVTAIFCHNIRAAGLDSATYIFCGLASNSIAVYEVSPSSGLAHLQTITLAIPEGSIVNAIHVFPSTPVAGQQLREIVISIAIGTRDGTLFTFELDRETLDHAQSEDTAAQTSWIMGATPVRFVPCPDEWAAALLILCGSTLHSLRYIYGQASEIVEVFLTRQDDLSFQASPVMSLCIHTDTEGESLMACVCRGCLVFANLSHNPCDLVRCIPIHNTPSRIMWSNHLQMLIVGGTLVKEAAFLETRSCSMTVDLVDPWWSKTTMTSSTDTSPVKGTYYGDPGETLCALQEWFISRDGSMHHFIIATTVEVYAATASHPAGRRRGAIKFLRVSRTTDENYKIEQYQESKEREPVYAICACGFANSLLYCVGNELKMRTYNARLKRFEKRTLTRLPSPGLSISMEDDLIFVSTASDSVRIFRYNSISETISEDDDQIRVNTGARDCISHCLVRDQRQLRGAVFSTKHQSVVFLPVDNHRTRSLESSLHSSISRFCEAPRNIVQLQYNPSTGRHFDVLGVSPDGSLTRVTGLGEDAWRFARFVQNLCQRRFEHRIESHLEPLSGTSHDMNVNGDTLSSLIERSDAEEILSDMLDVEPVQRGDNWTDAAVDFATAADRRGRFEELFLRVRPCNHRHGTQRMGTNQDDMVESTRRCLATMTTTTQPWTRQSGESRSSANSPSRTGDAAVKRALLYLRELLASYV